MHDYLTVRRGGKNRARALQIQSTYVVSSVIGWKYTTTAARKYVDMNGSRAWCCRTLLLVGKLVRSVVQRSDFCVCVFGAKYAPAEENPAVAGNAAKSGKATDNAKDTSHQVCWPTGRDERCEIVGVTPRRRCADGALDRPNQRAQEASH
jgi:hypothetical protein